MRDAEPQQLVGGDAVSVSVIVVAFGVASAIAGAFRVVPEAPTAFEPEELVVGAKIEDAAVQRIGMMSSFGAAVDGRFRS